MNSASPITLQRITHGYRGTFTAMANPCELLCQTDDASLARELTELAQREALRIERKFSRYRADSIITAINTAQGRAIELDDETAQLIDYATQLWQLTDGAFDITSGILRHAWKFTAANTLPDAGDIATLLQRVGWQRVQWHCPLLTMPAGMELDLGGIGKEYAVDRSVMLLAARTDVPMLINFGGDLRAAGAAPASGSWQVGIESISARGQASDRIELLQGAIATSGDTYRAIEVGGKRYGHILDARTGWPAEQAPRSITVMADTCVQAGTFTTLAMLRGADAEAFLDEEGVRYWCLR